jgi:hypothetical protein
MFMLVAAVATLPTHCPNRNHSTPRILLPHATVRALSRQRAAFPGAIGHRFSEAATAQGVATTFSMVAKSQESTLTVPTTSPVSDARPSLLHLPHRRHLTIFPLVQQPSRRAPCASSDMAGRHDSPKPDSHHLPFGEHLAEPPSPSHRQPPHVTGASRERLPPSSVPVAAPFIVGTLR